MTARVCFLACLAACEPSVAPRPLPPLLVPPPATKVTSGPLFIVPGEHLIWEVASDGMPIGRAELVTRDHEIESRFATDGLASMVASVHHDLTTPIDYGVRVHSIHSALAWLRAWEPRDGAPAVLDIEFDGDRYRLACDPPVPDELHEAQVIRVACEVDRGDPIALTFWFSADHDRLPVSVMARAGSLHLQAELVAH
jgi:hypothetical protein